MRSVWQLSVLLASFGVWILLVMGQWSQAMWLSLACALAGITLLMRSPREHSEL